LNSEIENLEKKIDQLNLKQGQIRKAMVAAINKALRSVYASTTKDIADYSGIRLKTIRARAKMFPSYGKSLKSVLSILTYDVPALIGMSESSAKAAYPRSFIRFIAKRRGVARRLLLMRQGKPQYPLFEGRINIAKITDDVFKMARSRTDSLVLQAFKREIERHMR